MSWLTSDSKSFSFDGDKADSKSAGQYKVPIKLQDKYGASTSATQVIMVEYIEKKEEEEVAETDAEETEIEEATRAPDESTTAESNTAE